MTQPLTEVHLEKLIDHTLLDQGAPHDHVRHAAEIACRYHTIACCLRPTHLAWVLRDLLKGKVRPCAAIGFKRLRLKQTKRTTGQEIFSYYDVSTEDKILEIASIFALMHEVAGDGVVEFDFPVNLLKYVRGDKQAVQHDLEKTIQYCHQQAKHFRLDTVVKVIGENALLKDEQKREIYTWAKEAGADMVKTSTGFTLGGATVADVKLMREIVGKEVGVKAAGGVTQFNYLEFVDAGVDRIGTSKGMEIMEDYHARFPQKA